MSLGLHYLVTEILTTEICIVIGVVGFSDHFPRATLC